jgi:hypothetical protein
MHRIPADTILSRNGGLPFFAPLLRDDRHEAKNLSVSAPSSLPCSLSVHEDQKDRERFFDSVTARPEERATKAKAGRHSAQNDAGG